MRFEATYTAWQDRRLTREEAASLLGVCERSCRRYSNRYEEAGLGCSINGLIRSHFSARRCLQVERQEGKDSCVSYGSRKLQLPPGRHSTHYIKATVRVHEYADGHLVICHSPRKLTCFDAAGNPIAVDAQANLKDVA